MLTIALSLTLSAFNGLATIGAYHAIRGLFRKPTPANRPKQLRSIEPEPPGKMLRMLEIIDEWEGN